MNQTVSAQHLFDTFKESLALTWLKGQSGADTPLVMDSDDRLVSNLVGFLNLIHPPRVQVIDRDEQTYLNSLGKNSLQDSLEQLFSHTGLVIVSHGGQLPEQALALIDTRVLDHFVIGDGVATSFAEQGLL